MQVDKQASSETRRSMRKEDTEEVGQTDEQRGRVHHIYSAPQKKKSGMFWKREPVLITSFLML